MHLAAINNLTALLVQVLLLSAKFLNLLVELGHLLFKLLVGGLLQNVFFLEHFRDLRLGSDSDALVLGALVVMEFVDP